MTGLFCLLVPLLAAQFFGLSAMAEKREKASLPRGIIHPNSPMWVPAALNRSVLLLHALCQSAQLLNCSHQCTLPCRIGVPAVPSRPNAWRLHLPAAPPQLARRPSPLDMQIPRLVANHCPGCRHHSLPAAILHRIRTTWSVVSAGSRQRAAQWHSKLSLGRRARTLGQQCRPNGSLRTPPAMLCSPYASAGSILVYVMMVRELLTSSNCCSCCRRRRRCGGCCLALQTVEGMNRRQLPAPTKPFLHRLRCRNPFPTDAHYM